MDAQQHITVRRIGWRFYTYEIIVGHRLVYGFGTRREVQRACFKALGRVPR